MSLLTMRLGGARKNYIESQQKKKREVSHQGGKKGGGGIDWGKEVLSPLRTGRRQIRSEPNGGRPSPYDTGLTKSKHR